jgi:hypothetical protein
MALYTEATFASTYVLTAFGLAVFASLAASAVMFVDIVGTVGIVGLLLKSL